MTTLAWVDPKSPVAAPLPDPLTLPLLRPACEDTEEPLPLPSPSPPPPPRLPGPWAGCPALSGRVAAVGSDTVGSDTLGPALAVSEGTDCKLWGRSCCIKHTREGVTMMGREHSQPSLGPRHISAWSSRPWGQSSTGSPGTPGGLLFTSPSLANHGFLFPTASDARSLAFSPGPPLPCLSLMFIRSHFLFSQTGCTYCVPRRGLGT